jgi:DNA polymerase V
MIAIQEIHHAQVDSRIVRPLFSSVVSCGFPSPADDYIDRSLDLNEHLIKHPAATFYVRASGNSMIGAGIHSGDLLIVDRALEPKDGSIIVAVIEGELTVKRLRKRQGVISLAPENPEFQTLFPSDETDFTVWGVVIHVIHSV